MKQPVRTLSLIGVTLAVAYTGSLLGAARRDDDQPRRGWLVPVGGVVMWWGERTSIPAGYELCDGRPVQDGESALRGRFKPDLIGRFPKGAAESRDSLADLIAHGKGGSNDLPAHHHGLGTLATAPNTGSHEHGGGEHQHSILASDDDAGDDNRAPNSERDAPRDNITTQPGEGAHTHTGGVHAHTFTGVVGKPDAASGDAPIKDANQPAYCELFFIIRVR